MTLISNIPVINISPYNKGCPVLINVTICNMYCISKLVAVISRLKLTGDRQSVTVFANYRAEHVTLVAAGEVQVSDNT